MLARALALLALSLSPFDIDDNFLLRVFLKVLDPL